MATLPRSASHIKSPTPPSVSFTSATAWIPPRPFSQPAQFDAGIQSSAAWAAAEHIEKAAPPSTPPPAKAKGSSDADPSLSDDEPDEDEAAAEFGSGRPARALYAFEGKAEFRELSIEAGDAIEVLKEELSDGWSLVNHQGEVGLLPRSYYTFTSDFVPAPELFLSDSKHRRDGSSNSVTPRGSPNRKTVVLPGPQTLLKPQTTGEWIATTFPSFRRSLLGGKSLNRFSNFVTSGAEDWVLNGSPTVQPGSSSSSAIERPRDSGHTRIDSESDETEEEEDAENKVRAVGQREAERHFVEAGPAWRQKIPPFRVYVHSPSKRTSTISGAYTVYSVTSLFYPPPSSVPSAAMDPTRITVHRRFSHFIVLHTALTRHLPGVALPPLPEKQYAGRFSDAFVEARRSDLERYLSRIVRHPIARYAEVLTFFLGCESDIEWKKQLPKYLALPPAGPAFFAHVFHPAFNLDAEDAADSVDRFERHTRAVSKSVQSLRNIFGGVRAARAQMSHAERLLSYSLLSLITSTPLASAPTPGIAADDDDDSDDDSGSQTNNPRHGLSNAQGAWCWREDCDECLKLTKGMQRTVEALQEVADLYDDHARRRQLKTHESLKDVAHPSTLYSPVVETHRSTLSRYKDAMSNRRANEEVAARCETVLNTTMAEMETYHTQKVEDFRSITTNHLDAEIKFYEQVLERLRSARETFDEPEYSQLSTSHRQPSPYEYELADPRLSVAPLTQPCPHVYDSAPMRPVSAAIQEGVGMLLGSNGAPSSGRSSVLGMFW